MYENEKSVRRRDWVKNFAIIFLSIMLVLTFFSNTIMNYSLPEVATEYVQTGTITEKVRGTGAIEATDPYSIVISESRKIESVAVKNGDEVEKDGVLFYLEDVESTELKTAEKELEELRLAYLTGLFTGDVSSDVISKVTAGNTGSLSTFQTQLQSIDSQIASAKAKLDTATINQQNTTNTLSNLNGQKGIKEADVVDTSGEEAAVVNANTNVSNAEAVVKSIETEVAALENKLKEAETLLGAPVDDGNGNITIAGGIKDKEKVKADAETMLNNANVNLSTAQNELAVAQSELAAAEAGGDAALIEAARAKVDAAQAKATQAQSDVDTASAALSAATGALQSAQDVVKQYESNRQALSGRQSDLVTAKANLENAQEAQRNAQASLDIKKVNSNNKSNLTDLNKQIAQADSNDKKANNEVKNLTDEITKLEEKKQKLVKSITSELSLGSKNSQIALKEAEIEKLKEKSVGTTITSPVAGTVAEIKLVAGESTKPEEAVAVVQPKGKGFTLGISATTEQAKKLQVGDIAELQSAWYYDEVKVVLAAIKPDPNEPAQKKLLVFNVEGEVQAGQSLSISVGQRSSNYELVVPNSAIREDKNGKFILTVESRNSPLGNRYIATKVDVEVLASDDTHTAISAGLFGYEYVITTATKPVEAGKQVRLTD